MKILSIVESRKVNGGACSNVMKQAMLEEMKRIAGFQVTANDEARMKKTINSMCM